MGSGVICRSGAGLSRQWSDEAGKRHTKKPPPTSRGTRYGHGPIPPELRPFQAQSTFAYASYCEWRPEPESNRRARICSPLRHHSAIGPQSASLRFWPASGKWAAVPALFPAHCRHLPQTGAIAADRTIASRKIAPPLSAYLRGKDFHCALQKSYRSRQCQLLCCMDNTVMPSGIS